MPELLHRAYIGILPMKGALALPLLLAFCTGQQSPGNSTSSLGHLDAGADADGSTTLGCPSGCIGRASTPICTGHESMFCACLGDAGVSCYGSACTGGCVASSAQIAAPYSIGVCCAP